MGFLAAAPIIPPSSSNNKRLSATEPASWKKGGEGEQRRAGTEAFQTARERSTSRPRVLYVAKPVHLVFDRPRSAVATPKTLRADKNRCAPKKDKSTRERLFETAKRLGDPVGRRSDSRVRYLMCTTAVELPLKCLVAMNQATTNTRKLFFPVLALRSNRISSRRYGCGRQSARERALTPLTSRGIPPRRCVGRAAVATATRQQPTELDTVSRTNTRVRAGSQTRP